MKALALLLALLPVSPALVSTANPVKPQAELAPTLAPEVPVTLQVQVNDRAHQTVVAEFFKQRKTPVKFVDQITSDSYVQVSLSVETEMGGAMCKAFVVASNRGTYVQYPAYQGTGSPKANSTKWCQKFLAESLDNALRMVF